MSLTAKVEKSFAALVLSLPGVDGSGLNIYTGQDSDEQIRPCVVCWAQGGPEEPQGIGGNKRLKVRVIVKSQADIQETGDTPPEDAHSDNVDLIFGTSDNGGGLSVDNLADLLNGVALSQDPPISVYFFDPILDAGDVPDISGRAFTDARDFDVYVSPSLLT